MSYFHDFIYWNRTFNYRYNNIKYTYYSSYGTSSNMLLLSRLHQRIAVMDVRYGHRIQGLRNRQRDGEVKVWRLINCKKIECSI
jgi:hypothetical protein